MAAVTVNQVKKTYDNGHQAIKSFDLAIEPGEFVVLVGPSGCGKSTMLRSLAGLESISEGEIWLGGERVDILPPAKRDIAMVFQNYALYPHMTVYNNMGYGLKNRGIDKASIDQKVRRVAEKLELSALLDRKPGMLSGGQRQRVAMGRAMVRNPQLFLFDEPLSNLDAKLRVQMRIEIKKLQRELSATTLYVTHDQVEAMTLADKLVVMNLGEIMQVGTPLELYERPANRFVAAFIGSPAMNFFDSQLLAYEDIHFSDKGGSAVGVRPEHLSPCEQAQADLLMRVEMTEPLGADTLVYGKTVGNADTLVARLQGNHHYPPGDALPLRYERQHLHFFDKSTGERVEHHFKADAVKGNAA